MESKKEKEFGDLMSTFYSKMDRAGMKMIKKQNSSSEPFHQYYRFKSSIEEFDFLSESEKINLGIE